MSVVFSFFWELKWPQEKLETMLMQNFGVPNKEYYGMLWYFLEWSIVLIQVYNCDGSGTIRSQIFSTRKWEPD